MQRLLRATQLLTPVLHPGHRCTALQQGVGSFVTNPGLDTLNEQKFFESQLPNPTTSEVARYDSLPQDNYLAPRLHGHDLFHVERFKRFNADKYAIEEAVQIQRLDQQVFSLPAEDREIDGDSYDTTDVRAFGQLPAEFFTSPHFQLAVEQLLKTVPRLSFSDPNQFALGVHALNLRIDPSDETLLSADATPEGVHQDGANIVMINYIGAENVHEDSANTYLWTLDQPIGQPDVNDPEQQKNIIQKLRLSKPGQYFLLADRDIRHHVTEIFQDDVEKRSTRKVLVMYLRDFKESDNLEPHSESPFVQRFSLQ